MVVVSIPHRLRRDNKAAMGIGTLIVFIAMIMVAAVAAAVMIAVSNALREQAETVNKTKTKELGFETSGLRLLGIVADMKKDGLDHMETNTSVIQELKIRVGLIDPRTRIKLDSLRIHIFTKEVEQDLYPSTENFIMAGGKYNTADQFTIDPIYDDDNSVSDEHILNEHDWITIWIDCNYTDESCYNLTPSTDVTLELEVKERGMSKYEFTTPAIYDARYIVLK
jgi:flagellin FlaB